MKLFILIAIVFCVYNNATAQANANMFIPNEKKIDSLLSKTYSDTLPGVTVAILHEGKSIFKKSYGVSNAVTKSRITSASDFNICSLTKQFTAIAILQLEEKHLLSLNDKISRFFPGMNKKLADAITIQQLLTHSSGIPDHYDYTNTANMKHAHNSDVYNAVKDLDSTYFIPGTQFRYSNTAYCLLALVIEKLSGMSYNKYLYENIFKPAGMNNTVVWNENTSIPGEVTAYERDSNNNFIRSGPDEHIFFSTEGDGGIYTSADDYIKWFTALQSGKPFSKAIIDKARSIEFTINKTEKAGYGFGWFIDGHDAAKKVYHSGDNGGFRTYSFSIPALNYLVIIFSNRNDINIEKLVQQIVKLQLPAMLPFIEVEVLTS
jgi:D-alanyl-D-alanine carboxypeptidase